MKRIILLVWILILSLSASADIIITKSNGNIENVTIVKITDTEIVYTQEGVQKTIPYVEVEAVMYDDGRYITLPNKNCFNSKIDNETFDGKDTKYINRTQKKAESNNNKDKHSETKNSNTKQALKEAKIIYKGKVKAAKITYVKTVLEAKIAYEKTVLSILGETKNNQKNKDINIEKASDTSISQPKENDNW